MQKRWLLLISLAGVGTTLCVIDSAFSSLLLGLMPLLGFSFVFEVLFQMKDFNRQRLLVTMPFPKNTPLTTIPLFLGVEDGKVYGYLIRHGGKKAGGNDCEMHIKYSGDTIYDQKTNTFTVEGGKHRPEALRIREQDWKLLL